MQWYIYKRFQSYDGRESYDFVFRRVCFAPELVPRIFGFNVISETGQKFPIWTQGQIGPDGRASPVNRAHDKKPGWYQFISCH